MPKKGCIKDKSFVFYICIKNMKPSRKSRLKQRMLVSRKSVLFLAFYAVLVGASMSLDGKNELIFCRVALTTNFFAKLTPFLENKIVPKIGCSALLWNSTVSCTYTAMARDFSRKLKRPLSPDMSEIFHCHLFLVLPPDQKRKETSRYRIMIPLFDRGVLK